MDLECKLCGRAFTTHGRLVAHSKRMHNRILSARTTTTGSSSSASSSFTSSSRDPPSFGCAESHKLFDAKEQLHCKAAHHHSYECEYCSAIFLTSTNLMEHRRSAHDEATYACQYCGKIFNKLNTKQIHERSHTEKRKCVCPVCNRAFFTPSQLARHSLVHNPKKAYLCTICYRAISRKDHLRTHLQNQHNIFDKDELRRLQSLGKIDDDAADDTSATNNNSYTRFRSSQPIQSSPQNPAEQLTSQPINSSNLNNNDSQTPLSPVHSTQALHHHLREQEQQPISGSRNVEELVAYPHMQNLQLPPPSHIPKLAAAVRGLLETFSRAPVLPTHNTSDIGRTSEQSEMQTMTLSDTVHSRNSEQTLYVDGITQEDLDQLDIAELESGLSDTSRTYEDNNSNDAANALRQQQSIDDIYMNSHNRDDGNGHKNNIDHSIS